MRIGTSRADRSGFIVFALLAALLAVLLITNRDSGNVETVQPVATFGDGSTEPAPTAAATTAPIPVPEPTPTSTAIPLPTATATPEPTPETAVADEPDNGTTAGNGSGSTNAGTTQAASAPAPAETTAAVPNPQPSQTTAAVPNPQPSETTTAIPNPQPGSGPAVTTGVTAGAPTGGAPAASSGGTFTYTLTATVSQPTLYSSLGGAPFMPTFNGTALPPTNPTVFGNPLVYRVLEGSPDDNTQWVKVFVPARPNGTVAYVDERQFSWGSSNRAIEINVSTNTVTVYEGGNVLLSTGAVTGKSSSRTPIANGWVEERLDGSGPNQGFIRPGGPYGTYALSLGVFSDDLNSFGGSIPKIALHGTNNPSLIGQYASNGCIRVETAIIHQIAGMVPLGSKVTLTR